MNKRRNKLFNINAISIGSLFFFKVNKVFAGIDCEKQKKEGGLIYWLADKYNIILILVPILIVVFSILDFVKALTAQKADDMKKAYSNLIKRLIIGVIVVFLPILINFVLGLFGQETCMWK